MSQNINAEVAAGLEVEPSDVEQMASVQNQPLLDAVTQRQRPRTRVLDGLQGKLKVYGDIPGYFLAIVNDEGGRVEECLGRGYDFVRAEEIKGVNGNVTSYNTDPGGKVRFAVNTSGAEVTYGYLMKQLLEHRQEDLDDLEKRNSLVDNAIRAGALNAREGDGRYVPKSVGITYEPGKGNKNF